MDDLQRQPKDSDRNPVRNRIKQAVADGRISPADGDIRLTNVGSAQSMAELGLIVRDLDQLDAAVRPAAPVAPGAPAPTAPVAAPGSGSRRGPVVIVVAALVGIVAAAAVGVFALVGPGDPSASSGTSSAPTASVLPATGAPSPEVPDISAPGVPAGSDGPAGAAYELSAGGIRAFLATYRQRFSTSKVVDLTLYDDYVVVQVPVAGRDRHSGWLYRDGRFSDFGGVTANFPGSTTVDTRRLDVPALMRNIAKARRTLKVEDYTTTYVSISYRPQFDPAPNVNVYVSNKFNESGYLATTLDGSVERAYPYAS